jgi:uncharacterized protein with HEPN domain
MSRRDWRFRIEDMLEAADRITARMSGMSREVFLRDTNISDVVLRNLTVIGEAAAHLPEDVTERYPEVPWRQIAAIRNIIVHEYFGVDLTVIWDAVQWDLPILVGHLRRIQDDEKREQD